MKRRIAWLGGGAVAAGAACVLLVVQGSRSNRPGPWLSSSEQEWGPVDPDPAPGTPTPGAPTTPGPSTAVTTPAAPATAAAASDRAADSALPRPAPKAARSVALSRPAATGIHAQLLEMPVDRRNALLQLAVRDASLPCETVNTASALPEYPVWRISCEGAHHYTVSVDELEKLRAEPIGFDAPPHGVRIPLELVPPERTLELIPAPEPNR